MPPEVYVPDTSVLVSGLVTELIERGELADAQVIIPEAVLAALEHEASEGHESGFNGLDEVTKLQSIRSEAGVEVYFEGPAPDRGLTPDRVRAITRRVASDQGATLMTSDRVQAYAARARGTPVWYLHPGGITDEIELESLELFQFFTDDTMSVHLKSGCVPEAKRGTPGSMRLMSIGEAPMTHEQLSRMSREIIEAARRDTDSFVEIERLGAAVVQLRNVRVAMARPPFSDAIEITAVRPVVKLELDEYQLPEEILHRIEGMQRGIFISGPPGSGKSTFAQALAEHLRGLERTIKTMESPRDLQLMDEITQYAPLEGSMELTSDVLLLVRPDYVIYDEVRKTDDFEIFSDMRLAGVGLVGVTHANRAIDAIQRLMGRVELGMIPQIVDTVIHIVKGEIQQVLQMVFSVKVPEGMMEQDLARPVIQVQEFPSSRTLYEIYTYGEQTVVMPVSPDQPRSARDTYAEDAVAHQLARRIKGDYEVEMRGSNSVTVFVEEWELPKLIGKGGENVQKLERQLGLSIDLRSLDEMDVRGGHEGGGGYGGGGGQQGQAPRGFGGRELWPEVRRTKKHMVLILDPDVAGEQVDIAIGGEPVFQATVGHKGEIRVRRESPEGTALQHALERGEEITVRT